MAWMCSADSHIIEPPDLWTARVPAALRDRAPHYESDDKFRWMCVDGQRLLRTEIASMALPDGTSVPTEPSERLPLIGVWAEALIGNMAGIIVLSLDDPEFAMACARAYNDYLAETYGEFKDRFVGLGLIPARDVDLAVAEIERVASIGLAGITMPILPDVPYFAAQWAPIWAAAAAHGLPISFHVNTGGNSGNKRMASIADALATLPQTPEILDASKTVGSWTEATQAFHVVASLIGAGVLERHPDLHVIFVETGAGWIAYAMDIMDWAWTPAPGQERATEDMTAYDSEGNEIQLSVNAFGGGGWRYPLKPSEYVRRQAHATFMDEPAAIKYREFTGVEPLLWGSDFPHIEGTWPRSQEIVDELFAGVSTADRAAITGGTFARLYGLTVPDAA